MKLSVFRYLGSAILVAALCGPGALAQIPDKFTNLKILPETISKRELVGYMREFAGALGVRCSHCHVGQNVMTLEGFDWASDEKETKRVARAMMKLTREINEKLLPTTGRESLSEVRCITCHRGLSKPKTLDVVLREVVESDGVPAALERYRELRQEYYGRGVFDFSTRTLSTTAEWLARQQHDIDGALSFAKLNAELNPDEANIHYQLGQLHEAKGDKAQAIASYQRCLVLQPDNVWAKKAIEKLKGVETPD